MRILVGKLFFFCALFLSFSAQADTLYVSGTVFDSTTGASIAGAVVSLRSGGGFGGRGGGFGGGVSDTTAADGSYSIAMINDSATVRVTVMAANYRNNMRAPTISIAKPKDGITDKVTLDIPLIAGGQQFGGGGTGDTVVVTGTVVDSSGNPADSVTVTARGLGGSGIFGGGGNSRGVLTGKDGKYSITFKGDSNGVVLVTASSRIHGTGTTEVTVTHPKDGVTDHVTADLKLGSLYGEAPGDSVVITGTVTDSTGKAVDSAIITVRAGSGIGAIGGAVSSARTLTGSNGTYSITIRGDTSGILVLTASKGRSTGSINQKVISPNDGVKDHVTADIQFGKRSAVIMPLLSGSHIAIFGNRPSAVYSLDGRYIGAEKTGDTRFHMAHQMVIRCYSNNQSEKRIGIEQSVNVK